MKSLPVFKLLGIPSVKKRYVQKTEQSQYELGPCTVTQSGVHLLQTACLLCAYQTFM